MPHIKNAGYPYFMMQITPNEGNQSVNLKYGYLQYTQGKWRKSIGDLSLRVFWAGRH